MSAPNTLLLVQLHRHWRLYSETFWKVEPNSTPTVLARSWTKWLGGVEAMD